MKFILNKNTFFKIFIYLPLYFLSQGDGTNHQKYWYYKSRLNNDFIKIGMKPGESIPINQRGLGQKGYPTNSTNSSTGMKTGDGISGIGLHLAALATEYSLLKTNNQNTDSVKHEIFCALNAINRLDEIVEPLLPFGWSMPLNGFLIRDDIDRDFLMKNYEHFNYYNSGKYVTNQPEGFYPIDELNDRGFCSLMQRGQTGMSSDFIDVKQNEPIRQKRLISQDHIISLLLGLSLINKLVDYSATDDGAIFPYENQGVTSLKQEAWNISDRLAQHLKNDPTWRLIDPVNGQPVDPGGNTTFTKYGMAEGLCRSANYNTNLPNPFIPITNPFGSLYPYTCNYNTPHVYTAGLTAWLGFMATGPTSGDNAVFKVNLLATGNTGWQPAPVDVSNYVCNWVSVNVCNSAPWPINLICSWVNQLLCGFVTISVPGYKNETQYLINTHAEQAYAITELIKENVPRAYGFWHAPLLHKVLYPNSNVSYSSFVPTVKGALDNAPCEGPYNFGQFARPQFEWTSENRIEKSWNRQDWNEPDNGWLANLDVGINNPALQIHTKRLFLAKIMA